MLVEDIPKYISQDDYETDRVKKIQTFGRFLSKSEAFGKLVSLTPGNTCQFPVSFKNLNVTDIYVKISDDADVFCPIWKRYDVFKVYGTLTVEEGLGHVLQTYRLVPVHDIEGTWKLMNILMKFAQPEYHRYHRTKGQTDTLCLQLEEKERQRELHKKEKESNKNFVQSMCQ
ncbi:uncharacterized protein LOC108626827 isoform X2 [Ceratina calcarata]|nr:uncharacterized protein LOC108626827 isoform X2 [Ceratina calcarata]